MMNTFNHETIGQIEVKTRQQLFYAILRIDNQVVYTSDLFHTEAAATMAAQAMGERYQDNFLAAAML